MNELGNKIAKKRKDLGITQTEFADRMSVTRQAVSRWEAGAAMPDIDKISDIAEILGVSCDYLLKDNITEEESETPSVPSRLLQSAVGRTCRLMFYEDEADIDLYNKDCVILGIEGGWMTVSAETAKGHVEKMIPSASVLSVEIRKEEN